VDENPLCPPLRRLHAGTKSQLFDDSICVDGKECLAIHNITQERRHSMKKAFLVSLLAMAACLTASTSALADFAGQTIFGPIGPGSVVNGNTTGATDDNDGIMSGVHYFEIWNAPDDVWELTWPGGDLALEMTYDNSLIDLDLFLYRPGSYDDSGDYSILNSGIENILLPAAEAGTYYVLIDGPNPSDVGPYTLAVTPEPTTLALLGLGLVFVMRRSR
jgi:hypothetical protein